MTAQDGNRKHYDVTEYLKKDDYKESSSGSNSKISEHIKCGSTKLRTLPQAAWHEMDEVMAELKATLPYISPNEVRRFFSPFHEALILELEEQKYEEAAHELRELLRLDDEMKTKSLGLQWKKLYLKDQKDLLERLMNALIDFENAGRNDDYVSRAVSLLNVSLFVQTKTWEWWWIAERFYSAALAAAHDIENDNRYTITMIRYLYGRFLFHELQNPKEALDHLKAACEASNRKTWNASKMLGEKQATIFIESNILLQKISLNLARKERPTNPDLALKLSIEALNHATDADSNEHINEALHELGKSYLAVKDMKRALKYFSKLLAMSKRTSDTEGVCTAHMELAFAYKQLDDNIHTEKHLRLFRENAKQFCLFQKLADAHYYTGEHYVSKGILDLATAHLESSLQLYNLLNLSREADRARSVAGVSKGQEKMAEFFKLIYRCGEYEEVATTKLLRWRSRRKPFWDEEIYEAVDYSVDSKNGWVSEPSAALFRVGFDLGHDETWRLAPVKKC